MRYSKKFLISRESGSTPLRVFACQAFFSFRHYVYTTWHLKDDRSFILFYFIGKKYRSSRSISSMRTTHHPFSLDITFVLRFIINLIELIGIDLIRMLKNWLNKKNDFAEISKNLARYKSENNFVWCIEIIM